MSASRLLRNAAFMILIVTATATYHREVWAFANVCDQFPGCYCIETDWPPNDPTFDVSCNTFPYTCSEAKPDWCNSVNDACYTKCGERTGQYQCSGYSSYECEGWCFCIEM
jgi:hypothetical protein